MAAAATISYQVISSLLAEYAGTTTGVVISLTIVFSQHQYAVRRAELASDALLLRSYHIIYYYVYFVVMIIDSNSNNSMIGSLFNTTILLL